MKRVCVEPINLIQPIEPVPQITDFAIYVEDLEVLVDKLKNELERNKIGCNWVAKCAAGCGRICDPDGQPDTERCFACEWQAEATCSACMPSQLEHCNTCEKPFCPGCLLSTHNCYDCAPIGKLTEYN